MRTALLCLLAAALIRTEAATVQTGEVVQIANGDTLTVRVDGRRRKLRLAGIDAPEPDQPFGARARKALAALVFGQRIRFESSPADTPPAGAVLFSRGDVKVERGPVAARVYVGQTDVGAELLRQGYAWVARGARDNLGLVELEREARAARRGLWAGAAVAPWEWRRREPPPEDSRVFCTQDVKPCPDGSWVPRRPPGCTFAACPGGGAGDSK